MKFYLCCVKIIMDFDKLNMLTNIHGSHSESTDLLLRTTLVMSYKHVLSMCFSVLLLCSYI